MATATSAKVPISALPLPSTSQILTHNLTADEAAPTVSAFRDALATKPSIQRRARLLAAPCHFSYVSPFPIPFPFAITAPEDGDVIEDKAAYVEKWLSAREAVHERPGAASGVTWAEALKLHYPQLRDQPRELIGLSETGLRDCLQHLDVGDAFATLGTPTLANEFEDEEIPTAPDDDVAVRQELVDVLSGHAVLMSGPEAEVAYAPWSLRYSGHQFGSWAGQLGDGRAISLLATPHPNDPDTTWEIQLKGAGRTPFSRSADGLAVLRSSIREFLCAEAMHALHIPTTRSLTLIHLPALQVARERMESACVLARVAPSFLRIGSFEALNGPQGMFFFGGGQQDADYDALWRLGLWVARRVLRLEGVDGQPGGRPWAKELVMECARRNACMVAGWQAYGWMHGVINTDNVSVLGLTIDYGPYAFMDVFDPLHICNHSDDSGRYAYKYQPNMIIYAMRALLNALAPLIGAEAETGQSVSEGWADGMTDENIKAWTEQAIASVGQDMDSTIVQTCAVEYARIMHQRLGLRRIDPTDEADLVRPLLDLMKEHRLDFHGTFRKLCFFRPSLLQAPAHIDAPPSAAPAMDGTGSAARNSGTTQSPLEKFLSAILSQTPEPERLDRARAASEWLAWLEKYAKRIESERGEWTGADDADVNAQRAEVMKAANPRFVLRQWVLEEVIKRVEQDADSGKRILAKVLKMACEPFSPWGAEGDERDSSALDAETRAERRLCGMGERKMLGFQCSCSS